MVCPDCGKLLTGSKSKGRNRYYAYYHCIGGCTHRVNAEKVNAAIVEDLIEFLPKIQNVSFYEETISKEYLGGTLEIQSEKKEILAKIKDYEDRLSHTRDLLATRQIEAEDYREMKSAYCSKISALEAKLNRVNHDSDNIQILIKQGINKLVEIEKSVMKGELSEISKEIGSIYPEKMIFSESQVRTARRNDFIQHIN